ncbi:MAG: hypothetical protein QGF59_12125 [Pirellulaceae bacterium]|jgi:hypothetical protein|nr:hypothetical protein [Pirellulaceae bacterium]|tara:strand:- start:3293 stop:3487 length:195 start_codon:yes stop_codon:yes gene_type:complete
MTGKYLPLHSAEAEIGLLIMYHDLVAKGETKAQAVRLDAMLPDTFTKAETLYQPTKHDLKEEQS